MMGISLKLAATTRHMFEVITFDANNDSTAKTALHIHFSPIYNNISSLSVASQNGFSSISLQQVCTPTHDA